MQRDTAVVARGGCEVANSRQDPRSNGDEASAPDVPIQRGIPDTNTRSSLDPAQTLNWTEFEIFACGRVFLQYIGISTTFICQVYKDRPGSPRPWVSGSGI